MIKITHVITDLDMGGAERMLYNIVTKSDKKRYTHTVISMMDMGYYGPLLIDQGVQVFCLNMERGIPRFHSVLEARKLCGDVDIIQTWMYHADLFGTMLRILLPGKKLIWGIRQSDIHSGKDTKSTIRTASINAKLSWLPQAIICNSRKGIENHTRFGYNRGKMRYIPNGIDTEVFYRRKVHSDAELSGKPFTICTVGRWDPQKGYQYLFGALRQVHEEKKDFLLLMCGHQLNTRNESLVKLISEAGIIENIKFFDQTPEVYNILSQSDIFILPSIGEGFSNALGEAMACELPCIVTDVGDSAEIAGDCGWVVLPGDADALASAVIKAADTDRDTLRAMGARARERVRERFGIISSVRAFEALYEEV